MEDLLTSVNPLWKNQVGSRGRVVSVEKFKKLFDACVEYENGPLGGTDMKHQLQALRRNAGWTAEELARQMRVNCQTIYRWQRGDNLPHRVHQAKLQRPFARYGV